MFWRKSAPAAPAPTAPIVVDLADSALDTIGILLNALADSADDDDERRTLERWAEHILTQTQSPGQAVALTAGRRDWAGARAGVTAIVRARAQRATRAIDALREAMNAVTRSLSRAVAEDRAGNAKARSELLKLKEATETKSPEVIRRCALDAVAALSGLLDENERAWTGRLQQITERADHLQGRIVVAEKEAQTDQLTALTNRRGFDQQLELALEAATTFGDPSALILFDLDHFKKLNDQHGHVVGDAALRAFANTLALCFPRCGDCVARYGGEEFAVVLRRSGGSDALRLAERCVGRVRQIAVPLGGGSVSMTVSAGITELVAGEIATRVIARADAALYAAKREGRDRAIRR